MNRVKRVKNDNFTTISNVFLRDKELSLKAKGFLAVVMGLPEGWNFTVEGICAILKENKTAVYNTINELKKSGYCQSSRIKSDKGLFLGSDYTFFEEPNVDIHNVEHPHTENPHMDVPHTENVSQLNTYSNKVLIELNKDTLSQSETPAQKKPSIDERDIAFKLKVLEFKNSYPVELLKAFYLYWSQKDEKGKKMLFETKKCFEIKKRLVTWNSKASTTFKQTSQPKTNYQDATATKLH